MNTKQIMGKVILFGVLITTLLAFSACGEEERMGSLDKDIVFVHVGSPLVMVGDQISFLDPDDYGASVYKENRKIYLPISASKEIFGRDILYDKEKGKALLVEDGKEYVFSKTNKSIIEKNNRILISLSALGEKALKNHAYYKEDVIGISKNKEKISDELINKVSNKIGGATRAKSDAQLEKLMKAPTLHRVGALLRGQELDIAMDVAETTSMSGGDDGGGSFSETNVQVEGIDEADIIKTDGKYVYYSGDRRVQIFKVETNSITTIGKIEFDEKRNVRELFLDDDKLVVLGSRYENKEQYKVFAFADIYDVSDPKEPKLKKRHEMEGNYGNSRKKDDQVYLVTNVGGGFVGIPRPYYYDSPVTKEGEHKPMEIDKIMVLPEPIQPGYVVVSAINIKDDSKTVMEAITSYGTEIYMNESSLYVTSLVNENTVIHKFVIDGMKIGYGGTESVKGHLLNQFSMDEHEGYLRIATTEWNKGNNLYILDSSLNEVGSVKNFAEGERIYSARFMGDKGYIVTFKNIDPLFVFDLSDPSAPVITGELKIPGFSNYLHPVGKDLILGIGKETNELIERYPDGTEEIVGFREGGLKVSLFDVSDMGKPKEITNLVIGKGGSNSEATHNHKAVMVDMARQQVGFYGQIVRDKDWTNVENGALIVNFADNQLDLKALLKAREEVHQDGFYHNRVIYIGDTLYVFSGDVVGIYDYNSFEQLEKIKIK